MIELVSPDLNVQRIDTMKKVNRQTDIQTYRDYVQKKYNNNLYMLNKVSQIQSVYLQT